jgi:hypothetical protein
MIEAGKRRALLGLASTLFVRQTDASPQHVLARPLQIKPKIASALAPFELALARHGDPYGQGEDFIGEKGKKA